MRFSVTYLALAISGVASLGGAAASNCWATSTGVNANWGPLKDLRTDATLFCNKFSSDSTAIVAGSGKYVFGYQSAIFVGNFASGSSCLTTFNTLVSDCYGSTNPSRPDYLGGTITDPGGANLAISFGTGAQF